VVTNTWKVWHTTTTNEHYGVFLEVVTFATDVSPDFITVRQADTGNLTKGRVRLLRSLGGDLNADTTLEGGLLFVVLSFQAVRDTLKCW
jgi:hypothetical protein